MEGNCHLATVKVELLPPRVGPSHDCYQGHLRIFIRSKTIRYNELWSCYWVTFFLTSSTPLSSLISSGGELRSSAKLFMKPTWEQNFSIWYFFSCGIIGSHRGNSNCAIFGICKSSPINWERLLNLIVVKFLGSSLTSEVLISLLSEPDHSAWQGMDSCPRGHQHSHFESGKY